MKLLTTSDLNCLPARVNAICASMTFSFLEMSLPFSLSTLQQLCLTVKLIKKQFLICGYLYAHFDQTVQI
jgi:hypothetical protein